MPADNKPRWITVRKPFDYRWPDRSAMTAYTEADLGEHYVKAEVADFAVAGGYASEGKLDGSEAKAPKVKRKRAKRPSSTRTAAPKPATPSADAAAADNGSNAGMAGSDLAAADSAEVRGAVDPAAE